MLLYLEAPLFFLYMFYRYTSSRWYSITRWRKLIFIAAEWKRLLSYRRVTLHPLDN